MSKPHPLCSADALALRVRCYYADPAKRAERPYCKDIGVVAYGIIVLCQSCDTMRSAVGWTEVARLVPGAELLELIDAAAKLVHAEDHLGQVLKRARVAGASWTQLGDALGISWQAARSRLTNDDKGGTELAP